MGGLEVEARASPVTRAQPSSASRTFPACGTTWAGAGVTRGHPQWTSYIKRSPLSCEKLVSLEGSRQPQPSGRARLNLISPFYLMTGSGKRSGDSVAYRKKKETLRCVLWGARVANSHT